MWEITTLNHPFFILSYKHFHSKTKASDYHWLKYKYVGDKPF